MVDNRKKKYRKRIKKRKGISSRLYTPEAKGGPCLWRAETRCYGHVWLQIDKQQQLALYGKV